MIMCMNEMYITHMTDMYGHVMTDTYLHWNGFQHTSIADGHQQGQQFYQEFSHTHHESGLMPIMVTKVDMGVSQKWRPFQIYYWFPHNHFCAIFGSSPTVRHLQIHDMRPLRPPILEAKHVFCFFWLLTDWRWNGCNFSAKMNSGIEV